MWRRHAPQIEQQKRAEATAATKANQRQLDDEAKRRKFAEEAAKVARTIKAPDPHHYWVGMWIYYEVNADGSENAGDYVYINLKGTDENGVGMCKTLHTKVLPNGGAEVDQECAGEGDETPSKSKSTYEPLPNGRMKRIMDGNVGLSERAAVFQDYDPSGIGDLSCPETSHGC